MIDHHSSHYGHHQEEHHDVPPWERPVEPDHPMLVEGGVIDGNTELMFRCMVEEYLFAGHSLQTILEMCRQPNYQAFHAAMLTLGRQRAESIAVEVASRVGQHRVRESESHATATATTLTIGATTPSTRK